MKRLAGNIGVFLTLLLLLIVVFVPTPLYAATTATVVVNATPTLVSITNAPATYGFGSVTVSTNYSTANNYFNITNGSSVNIDVAISCNALWTGGGNWTHSDTMTPGADTAAMAATPGTAAWNINITSTGAEDLYNNTGTATLPWGVRLSAPTSFGDGVIKENTITLTATAH